MNNGKQAKPPIKRLREQTGLTQTEFAGVCGISKARLGNYERGGRTFDVEMARTFIKQLGRHGVETTLDALFPKRRRDARH